MNPKTNTPTKTKIKVDITARDLIILLFFIAIAATLYFSDSLIGYANTTSPQLEESRRISKEMADLSLEIDKINIDTQVLNSQFLQSVSALPSYPLDNSSLNFGKTNPFTGSNVVVATSSGVVAGVRYTSQTSTSTSVITTSPTATSTRR
jgi:hypothetical protein